jgi:HSP20 family protein
MLLNRRHPLGTLWREFNQAQDEFARWFDRTVGNATDPLLNVWEDENAVYAEVDLPGIDPAKLEISIAEGNQLTVQGERVPPVVPGVAWIRQERPFGKFVRVIGLPTLVDAEKSGSELSEWGSEVDASQARSGQAAENRRQGRVKLTN